MNRTPSIATLREAFGTLAPQAKRILQMTRAQLLETEAGAARDRECYNPPKTSDLRMHTLNALDAGFHGLESIRSTRDEYADYLNAGDSYASTLIYWRGSYRVASIGDFIEAQERGRKARFV